MDVRMPDGTIIKNVPAGITKAQLSEKLARKSNNLDTPTEMGSLHKEMLADAERKMLEGDKAAEKETNNFSPLLSDHISWKRLPKLAGHAANAIQAIPGVDEAISVVGSTFGAGKGENWKERYDNLQQTQQVYREAAAKNFPMSNAAGRLAGALMTARGTPTLRLPMKATGIGPGMVKGGAEGLANAMLYGGSGGFGDTNSFLPDEEAAKLRFKNAKDSAAWTSLVFGPLGAFGGAIAGRMANSKATKLTPEHVGQASGGMYDVADNSGGVLTPEFTNKFLSSAGKDLPQELAGKATIGDNEATNLIKRWEVLKDKPLTLKAAQEVDEGLSLLVDKHVDKMTGDLTKEGQQVYAIQKNFRKALSPENLDPSQIVGGRAGLDAWKEGQKLWAAKVRIGDIQRLIDKGLNKDVPATSIRSGFRRIMDDPGWFKTFPPEAQKLIKKASEADLTQEGLRLIGGRLSQLMATGLGGAFGNVPGAIAAAAASVPITAGARHVAGKMQEAKGQKVIQSLMEDVFPPSSPKLKSSLKFAPELGGIGPSMLSPVQFQLMQQMMGGK